MFFKLISALLLTLICTMSNAKTYIMYVNGALNSSENNILGIASPKQAHDKFVEISKRAGLDISDIVYEPIENIGYSGSPNVFTFQQLISKNAFTDSGTNPQSKDLKEYYRSLSTRYFALKNVLSETPIYNAGIELTFSFFNKVKNKIKAGDRVILVGHSQGNLYIEAVSALLLNDVEVALLAAKRVRVIGLGSAAATTLNKKYINIAQDTVLYNNGDRSDGIAGVSSGAFQILPANYYACFLTCVVQPESANQLISVLKNYGNSRATTHGAVAMYLNEDMDSWPSNYQRADPSYPITDRLGFLLKSAYFEMKRGVNDVSVLRIAIILNLQSNSNIWQKTASTVLAFLGIRDTFAEVFPSLFAYVNTSFTVRVEGTGFDGNEAVSIDGATCNKATIQRGSGYFTQVCTSGGIASDTNKIRVYDTAYDVDMTVPDAYQTMSLRGPILAPNAPTLADLGSGSVSVTWGAVAGVTSYEVYRGATLVRTVAATTLTITDTGLTAGVSSCYSIRAIANGAASQSSSGACITPVAPVQKCAGLWTTGQYNVGQTEQQTQACTTGYTGNKILTHSCQAGLAGSNVGAWSATTTQDNCVIVAPATCLGTWSSTRYNVGQVEEQFANICPAGSQGQVRTFHTCQAGGSWSANAQSDTCVATLVAPTGLSASSVSAVQNGVAGIRLVWTAVSGATRYYITRNGSSNYSSQVGTNWTDPNATAGVQYCYTVNAFSSFNNARSPESSQVCSVYQPTQVSISPPTNLVAARYTTGGRKDIRLTWTPPSPAPDSYQVFRRDRSGMLAPLGGSDTSFFDRYELNLTSGISYCYFIRAEKGGVISTESNETCSLAP